MSWAPTLQFLHGRVVKPFVPLTKFPALKNDSFTNLYPGDEVYIFETNGKWARGYTLARPLPLSFAVTSLNLDDLPGLIVAIAVFPLNHVAVVKEVPLNNPNGKTPPLPFESFTFTEGLVSEIVYAMNLLATQVYALYSVGEFRLFNNLVKVYRELDEIRVKLGSEIMGHEKAATEERATLLLNSIGKHLASRANRLYETYDLDHQHTDVSARKAVFARGKNGNLLTLESTPPAMALSQQLCALAPKLTLPEKAKTDAPSQILVDFKSVFGSSSFQPFGFAGMTAYLYVRNSKKRLTEAFAVHTEKVDELAFVEKMSAALFRNIPRSEVEHNRVYLVAVLTEELSIQDAEKHGRKISRAKRGVAAGVADITRVFPSTSGHLASGESHQFTIRLFGSFSGRSSDIENNGWGELVDRIISGSSRGVAVNARAEKLVVTVKEFKNELSDTALPVTSTTAPIAKIVPMFYDPLAENYERLYLKLGKLSVAGGSKDDLLTVEVSAPNNPLIRFAKASNQVEQKTWQFVSVGPGEVIGEIVKVNGIAQTNKSTPFQDSISLALYINGTYSGEGRVVYKQGHKILESEKPCYMCSIIAVGGDVPIARVEVTTDYIGKVFRIDLCIENILRHEKFFTVSAQGPEALKESLVAMMKLESADLIKYFPELIDNLMKIIGFFEQYPDVAELGFNALACLLDAVIGRQAQNCYMLDHYLAKRGRVDDIGEYVLQKTAAAFELPSAWSPMSRSVCRVLGLLIKMTVDSHPYEQMSRLVHAISKFVSVDVPALASDQILAMDIVDFLISREQKLESKWLLSTTVSFIDSVKTRNDSKTKTDKFTVKKLVLVIKLFSSRLAREHTLILVGKGAKWALEVFLGQLDVDSTRLACSVLRCVCDVVDKSSELCFSLTRLLFPVAKTFVKYNKFTASNESFRPSKSFTCFFPVEYPFKEHFVDSLVGETAVVEVLVELATVFVYIARIGNAACGKAGLLAIKRRSVAGDFALDPAYSASNDTENIHNLLSAIHLMRQGRYFPEDKWLMLYGVIAEGCLQALELLKPAMLELCLPSKDEADLFDRAIWGNYLRALLKLATIAPVSIEHLSTIPRKACFQITGSMRKRIALLMEDVWDALAWDATKQDAARFGLARFGGYQVEFIGSEHSILQDLMLFALQRNTDCQRVSVRILWSVLVAEYIFNEDTIEVEKECLIGLYSLYNRAAYKPQKTEQVTLTEQVKQIVQLDREDEAYTAMLAFYLHLEGFLKVLNDLNEVPMSPEFEDDRTFHKLNVHYFLKNANKPEMFHSFINQMYEENLKKKDHVQAALSLELLASTYTWDNHVLLPPSYRPSFPEQTSFERKEALTKMIASSYVKGRSLEKATDTYNELLEAYNEHTYDLKSFAYVHSKLSQLFLEMDSQDKLSPSYFRVVYIGNGFHSSMRSKEQILEGLPFEHITAVHERLLKLYPGARIVIDEDHAKDLREKPQSGRFLYVTTVEPVSDVSDKVLNASLGARQYARNKDLRFFSTVKKIPGFTSVRDLWTEEVTYETTLTFPTLMNRSDVKNVTVVRLSPLDNAVRTVINKNNDLLHLESAINLAVRDNGDYTQHMSDLSRELSGTVDAPVNGGVGQYRAFFDDLDDSGNVRLLRSAFDDLTMVLNRCLHLHATLVSPAMRPSHDALLELFKRNFAHEIVALKLDTDYAGLSYNHSVASEMQRQKTRRVTSQAASELGSAAVSISGLSLNRTASRLSRGSSGSNMSTPSTTTTPTKRTALNWRFH